MPGSEPSTATAPFELTEDGLEAGSLSIDVVAPDAETAKARVAESSGLVSAPIAADSLQAGLAED